MWFNPTKSIFLIKRDEFLARGVYSQADSAAPRMDAAAISRAAAKSSLAIPCPCQSSATASLPSSTIGTGNGGRPFAVPGQSVALASVLVRVKYPSMGFGLRALRSIITRVMLTPLAVNF